jgi:hypothetical protein
MNPTNSYNNVWVCGNSGTVINTINGGTTWVHVVNNGIPSNVNLVNISVIDNNNALTAGYSGANTYVYRTSNGGGNFSQIFTQSNGYINAIWMKNANTGFMEGNPVGGRWSLWKTTNGGFNWDSTGLRILQSGSESGWNNSLCIVGNRIWFGTNNSRIYYSSNFGTNWQTLSTPEVNSYSVLFYTGDSTFGYFGGSSSYRTTNAGQNWTILTCPGTGNFSGFTFGNLEGLPFTDFAVRNDSGINRNSGHGGGSSWMLMYSAPSGVYRHVAYSYSIYNMYYSWAVRSNGGITKFWIQYGEVKKISTDVPQKFSLSQNYPNPFNPITKIQYGIAKNSHVELKIFDAAGHQIAQLVNEQQTPGTYEEEFDGSGFASGVYFYKIEISDPETSSGLNFSETKKMVLIK